MLRFWIILAVLLSGFVSAQEVPIPAPPKLNASSYILLDYQTGKVLAVSNADERVQPASLTKLMTSYVVFKALKNGQIHLDDKVYISKKAWRTQGSRMFIEVGTHVSVDDLLQGMIVQSGNDASVALAEHVAGSESAFADLMNQYAHILGMKNSQYNNATGLPKKGHYSSARDTAILARAIIADFPKYYHRYYSERMFQYNGIKQHNRNALLWRDKTVDGLKTGHTDAAGYCLASSAERDGMRLISVVMGTPSADARVDDSQTLLNYGFRFFETRRLYASGKAVTKARVWKGEPEQVPLGLDRDLYVTIPRGHYNALKASMDLPEQIVAPLAKDAKVGEVHISFNGKSVSTKPLVSLQAVPEAGLWTRLKDQVMLWLH
jgi:D-alanyl-D-alanine carboxypeptidase (penicillin-binding protein 5/6)